MELTFRPADVSDIEALLVFMREYYEHDHFPFDRDHDRYLMTKWIAT